MTSAVKREALLKSWGFTDANDYSMLRVLKAVDLLNANNEPTELYVQYMNIQGGAAALAEPLRRIYAPLFSASHTPYRESAEKLQNLFNIHSGGGARALDQQIQTFKALCENTSFEAPGLPAPTGTVAPASTLIGTSVPGAEGGGGATVHINLHIHLPEGKSRRDYEAIIEDIGRHIFGRTDPNERED